MQPGNWKGTISILVQIVFWVQ